MSRSNTLDPTRRSLAFLKGLGSVGQRELAVAPVAQKKLVCVRERVRGGSVVCARGGQSFLVCVRNEVCVCVCVPCNEMNWSQVFHAHLNRSWGCTRLCEEDVTSALHRAECQHFQRVFGHATLLHGERGGHPEVMARTQKKTFNLMRPSSKFPRSACGCNVWQPRSCL
jgi:hypothetical protein